MSSYPLPFFCLTVGGIYTVLRSKAEITTDELGDQYFLIGPYNHNSVKTEVEILDPKKCNCEYISETISHMDSHGIKLYYGRWLIDGSPQVVLIDIFSASWKLDEWKQDFWNVCNIGIPWHDKESNDSIIFGYCVAWFLEEFYKKVLHIKRKNPLIVAHFHEWLSGVGLILSRIRHLDISTIFTTHATLLGRYLCAANVDFYNNLPFVR